MRDSPINVFSLSEGTVGEYLGAVLVGNVCSGNVSLFAICELVAYNVDIIRWKRMLANDRVETFDQKIATLCEKIKNSG